MSQAKPSLSLEDLIRKAKSDGNAAAEREEQQLIKEKNDDLRMNAAAKDVAVSMNSLMKDLRNDK